MLTGLKKDKIKVLKICFSMFNKKSCFLTSNTPIQNFDFVIFQSGDLVVLVNNIVDCFFHFDFLFNTGKTLLPRSLHSGRSLATDFRSSFSFLGFLLTSEVTSLGKLDYYEHDLTLGAIRIEIGRNNWDLETYRKS